jgi:copper(I)-binding protein
MKRIAIRLAALVAVAVLSGVAISQAGQAGKVDVTGKWVFAVETGAGTGTPTMTFKQDGEKLTGHYSGQLGEAELTGTVKGSDISFKFTVDVQGQTLNAVYTGTVDGKDSMKGKVDLVGLGEGTFTAKRQ